MKNDALIEHVSPEEDVLLVNPSGNVLEATVDRADAMADVPSIRVLAREDVYKAVTEDFPLATDLADLVERGSVELRVSDDVGRNPVLLTDGAVVVRITAGTTVEHVDADDESFVSAVRAAYEEVWATAEGFDLSTPARSRLRESLIDYEELGEPVWEDFAALLDQFESAPEGPDEVAAAVLAAARNERQLYHVSRWGEDVGLASKATFSRVKKQLQDEGVVETVRVPVEVGRPRQRLTLADGLGDADVEALAGAAAE